MSTLLQPTAPDLPAYVQALGQRLAERTEEAARHKAALAAANARLQACTQQLEAQQAQLERQHRQLRAQAQQLEEALARLLELDAMKSRFFANISHEFRTPLTLILGPLQDALRAEGSLSREQIDLMHRSGKRLLVLIGELLDLARLESGAMTLRAREGDLIAFLRGLVLAFSAQAERAQVTLSFHPAVPVLPLYFDPDKLEKVVTNLLANAFKFTSAHGKVRVAVRVAAARAGSGGGFAEVVVKDTGRGIPPEALPYVFDRFYQADGSAARPHEGTGIGLALAKELVELHAGRIEAESEEGFGTTFTVRLPLGKGHLAPEDLAPASAEPAARSPAGDEPAAEVEAATTPAVAAAPGRPTVLVVEDNADVRAYLRDHLAAHYLVEEAADGQEALERLSQANPSLVITDVMMPGLDGYALCRAIKTDPAYNHIPVILLTARASQDSRLEGLATGADDYLAKPFQAAELLARTGNLIAQRQALRQRFSSELRLGPGPVTVASAEAVFLEQVREAIEAGLGDAGFGVDRLAEALGMSVRQLQRRLKETGRLSAGTYIRRMRLERAAQLLGQGGGRVQEAAYAAGFRNADHFSRLFHRAYGIVPSQYHRAQQHVSSESDSTRSWASSRAPAPDREAS